ncbi:biotin--[acetyl-CoA-carboxylase] ligase [Pediococcus acidilactici]|uniref:biotin--[acetyl-CoA-carboxylase] ligase n=1 Tax=Pediococcus acidilactici TaxID=1254 RepID=UPI000FF592A2|nr:biotin--[acetyl-CoA-carboxylase] ligase [Pediococcus acidilactici]RWY85576.1 biotin--[acetyl-CoA-carboxylase] ligase [Pediococcus acidilactici]
MQINVARLQNEFPDEKIEYFDQVGSTNDVAFTRVQQNPGIAGMVVANQQTAGRGTNQRQFYSPNSGIYCSIYLPLAPAIVLHPGRVTANVGVIVAEAVHRVFGQSLGIKWVNDLYLHDQKVGGILCEAVSNDDNRLIGLVLGMGLNILTTTFPQAMLRTGGPIAEQANATQVTDLLIKINQAIQKKRQTLASDAINPKYLDLSILQDQWVIIDQAGSRLTGKVTGITPENELVINDGHQVRTVTNGRILRWQAEPLNDFD